MAKKCSIEGCLKKHLAQGYCSAHYNRLRRWGDPNGGGPLKPNADDRRPVGSPCIHPGCDGFTAKGSAFGYCVAHYVRFKRGLDMDKPIARLGKKKKKIDKNGYVYWSDPEHPQARGPGRVLEHRAVMAEIIGRDLLPGENVHHINGDRSDNRPENLELWVSYQPSGQRISDLVKWAKEILARYDESN